MSALVNEVIRPLQTELQTVRHQFAEVERKHHALELVLAQVPSDVEERLWIRLRPQVEEEIAKNSGAPHDVTNSLHDLSARIDAVDADLRSTFQAQITTAWQQVAELAEKVKTVEQLATISAERLARVPQLVATQIAQQQDSLLAVMRDHVKDIEALQRFRSDSEATLQDVVQAQTGFSALSDEIAQIRGRHFTDFQEQIERQIREQSEQIFSAAKTLIDEQRMKCIDNARAAADILQKVESTAEALKERIQKTVTDAQQQTLAVFEYHINHTQDNLRKQIADELKAFHNRAKVLSEEISARMRQELSQSFSRDREDMRAWLEQQTEDIHKKIHGAVLEADAEIKARNYITLETAKNSGEDLQREMVQQLQERAHRAITEFEERMTGRLADFQNSIEAPIGEALKLQVAESTKSFEIELNRLADESISRCRSALAQNLKSIANTLDDGTKALPP